MVSHTVTQCGAGEREFQLFKCLKHGALSNGKTPQTEKKKKKAMMQAGMNLEPM